MSTLDFTPSVEQAAIIAEQIKRRFPSLASKVGGRLESAVRLAAAPGVVVDADFNRFDVKSESNPAGSYRVDLGMHSCTCPDHGKHAQAGIVCKHRLAAYIKARCEPQPPARPVPQVGEQGRIRMARNSYEVEITHVTVSESGEPNWCTVQVLTTDWNGHTVPVFRFESGLGYTSRRSMSFDELFTVWHYAAD